jgi:hypothetical protein
VFVVGFVDSTVVTCGSPLSNAFGRRFIPYVSRSSLPDQRNHRCSAYFTAKGLKLEGQRDAVDFDVTRSEIGSSALPSVDVMQVSMSFDDTLQACAVKRDPLSLCAICPFICKT